MNNKIYMLQEVLGLKIKNILFINLERITTNIKKHIDLFLKTDFGYI